MEGDALSPVSFLPTAWDDLCLMGDGFLVITLGIATGDFFAATPSYLCSMGLIYDSNYEH